MCVCAKLMPEKDYWIWGKKVAAWRPIPLHPKLEVVGISKGVPRKCENVCLKNWLALPVGNEGTSTFTGWYIGDETSFIPYELGLEKWVTSWWFFPTHLEKYATVKLGSSSPGIGLNIKNV